MTSSRRRASLAVVFLVGAVSPVLAAGKTTSGLLLKESLGGRPAALADAGTALVEDVNALSFNPAGLATLRHNAAALRYERSLGEVSSARAGWARRYGWGTVGGELAYLDAGRIDLVFSSGAQYTRRAQTDYMGSLALALPLGDVLTAGVSVKGYSSELVGQYKASTVALDGGLLLRMPVPGWRLGASVLNNGGGLAYRSVSDPLPSSVRVGTSYSYSPAGRSPADPPGEEWHSREEDETPIFTAFLDGVKDRSGDLRGAAGLEWTQWPKAAFRGGYGWGPGGTGLTLGFGLNLGQYSLDYAWRFIDELDDSQRLSFSMYWGGDYASSR